MKEITPEKAIELLKQMYVPVREEDEARDFALSAIEKQIPKTIIPDPDDEIPKFLPFGRCPACGELICGEQYCPSCGQALKWGE